MAKQAYTTVNCNFKDGDLSKEWLKGVQRVGAVVESKGKKFKVVQFRVMNGSNYAVAEEM
jgi:hypothetical protein